MALAALLPTLFESTAGFFSRHPAKIAIFLGALNFGLLPVLVRQVLESLGRYSSIPPFIKKNFKLYILAAIPGNAAILHFMTTLSTRMLAKIADAAVSLARKLEGRSRLERAELLTGCFFLVVLLLMARRRRTKTAPEAARPEPGAPAKGRSLQPGGAEDGPGAAQGPG